MHQPQDPTRKPAISNEVWRKGWRQEVAATQAASAELAACFHWLDQNEYGYVTTLIREIAMEFGVRKTEAVFRLALRRISGKRP